MYWSQRDRALVWQIVVDLLGRKVADGLYYGFWIAVGVLLVYGYWPKGVWPRRKLIPPSCCQHCGYDLTGNVSPVCPECGQPVRK